MPKGMVFKTLFKSEIGIDFVNFGVKMGTFSGHWSGIIIIIS